MVSAGLVLVLGGHDDDGFDEEGIRAWGEWTRNSFTHEMFPGGHFFIQEHREDFLNSVSRKLSLLAV